MPKPKLAREPMRAYGNTNIVGRETNEVGMSDITSIFATPTLAALLAVFARNPERTYIQKELVQETGGSLYLVQRELKRLEGAGLVARETRGRQVEYTANAQHPAFAGLRDVLLATIALGDKLRGALMGLPGVRLAFIFGSVAAGEETPDSDLDVLVVGDLGLRDVAALLVPALRDTGREPNIVVMTEGDVRERAARGEHFVSTVIAGPKMWLVGDDDELAAVVGATPMSHTPDLEADLARLRALSGIKWSRYPDDVIAAWVADMDLPTAPPVADALATLVERRDFGYSFAAQAKLPEAWSEWMATRHGWRPDPKRVRVFTDVLQAVDLALYLGTKPGDGVVLLTPVYPPFFHMVKSTGRRVIDCQLDPDGWHLNARRLEASIDSTTTAILMCNPHNPTGRVFTSEELAGIADIAERHDLLIISDEIWADVVFSGAKHVPIASLSEETAARTVTVGAASKAFNLAGLRCAVAHIGPEAMEKQICELPGHLLGGVSSPGATAT
ncbi:MAG: aminotransferase class I/II-fold pyridoxal phosphate-dependent enzyme, partial [Dermatophilaceae bacterium]